MKQFELLFHPSERYFPTDKHFQDQVIPKVYYSEQPELYSYKGEKYKSILYEIYYKTNGAIGFGNCIFPKSKFLGYHEIDIERIIILYDVLSDLPAFVYFSAHRDEGKWLPYSACETTYEGLIKIYVAKYSHANYPSSGIWPRIYGLANDHCSSKGMKIVPDFIEAHKIYTVPNKEKRADFINRFFYR